MVLRRDALRLAGGALLGATAGCATGPSSSGGSTSTSDSPTGEPSPPGGGDGETPATHGTVDEWTLVWRREVPEEDVLGLTPGGSEALYAVLSNETGPSAVARVGPGDGTVVWRRSFEGEPVVGSYAGSRADAREHWGVTVGPATVYSVHGGYDWTALHAVDRRTGAERWSDRRRRKIAVHGIARGTVVATASEFARPSTDGPATEEPRRSTLLAYDAATGAVRWSRSFADVEDVAVGPFAGVGEGVPAGNAIYVAAGDRVVAVGLDGTRRFQFVGDRPARGVRVADAGVCYVTGTVGAGSTVHGLNSEGTSEWRRDVAASALLVDRDRLYAVGDVVVAIEPDGSVAWRHDRANDLPLLGPAGEVLYTSAPARTAPPGEDEAVAAYATGDGRRRFAFDPPGRKARPRAATAGMVVVEGVDDGPAIWAVDATDGGLRRRYDPNAALSTVVAAGDRTFAGDTRSSILAFEA